jgi:hypothetical protein
MIQHPSFGYLLAHKPDQTQQRTKGKEIQYYFCFSFFLLISFTFRVQSLFNKINLKRLPKDWIILFLLFFFFIFISFSLLLMLFIHYSFTLGSSVIHCMVHVSQAYLRNRHIYSQQKTNMYKIGFNSSYQDKKRE